MSKGPSRSVVRQDVIDAIEQTGGVREPLSASEIAEQLPCSKNTVYNRLRELAELERVGTMKVGARARVWWSRDGTNPPVPSVDGATFESNERDAMRIALNNARSRSPISSALVAEETKLSTKQAYAALDNLASEGWLASKKPGANARIWWVTKSLPTKTESNESSKSL